MPDTPVSIAVIDQMPERAELIRAGLGAAGYENVTIISDTIDLLARIAVLNPSVIIVDLENPKRDTVEQMFRVSREVQRPVVMFVDQSEPDMTQAAMEAGVSAYVVDGMQPDRIRPIVDLAIARFNRFHELETRVEALSTELEHRKTIEKAKGILMEQRGLSEKDAYALMRRASMDQKRPIVEIADSILVASRVGL
ncbi:ANTAR domain-containing response regulator [Pyruvatibacter mobilis]|uniref:ANTAR domain-containing response regulator n=1 Tax=Pyruvatibacter mobilis TaxID=1712261 RepID=UPI003BA9212E